MFNCWLAGSAATASAMSCRLTCRSNRTIGIVRLASAKLSNPHIPHPAGPTKRRRLAANASDGSPASHIRSTIPLETLTTASSAISLGEPDNSFSEAETERKILEIVRRGHQYRVGRTVVTERDRHFLGQGAFAEQRGAIAPRLPPDAPCRQAAREAEQCTATCSVAPGLGCGA